MFPEIGLGEMLVVGLVALLVVGPKDLPLLLRKAGRFVNRMRGMAADFRANFDELARQAELDELRKEVEALRNNSPLRDIQQELNTPFELPAEPETRDPPAMADAVAELASPVADTPSAPPASLAPPSEAGTVEAPPKAAPRKRAPRKPKVTASAGEVSSS